MFQSPLCLTMSFFHSATCFLMNTSDLAKQLCSQVSYVPIRVLLIQKKTKRARGQTWWFASNPRAKLRQSPSTSPQELTTRPRFLLHHLKTLLSNILGAGVWELPFQGLRELMQRRRCRHCIENSTESPLPPRRSAHTSFKAALGWRPGVGRAAPKVGGCFSFPSGFRFAFPFLPPPAQGGEREGGKRRACSQGKENPPKSRFSEPHLLPADLQMPDPISALSP